MAEYDFIEDSVGIALEMHSFIPTFHYSVFKQVIELGTQWEWVRHLPEAMRKRVVASMPTTCICRVM